MAESEGNATEACDSTSDAPINMCVRDKKDEREDTEALMGKVTSTRHTRSHPELQQQISSQSITSNSSDEEYGPDSVLQEAMVHSTDRRYKMIGKPAKDKTCGVCGDKALGYNFNAVSCESCKAFFRRNAGKEIRGRCQGKCEVTVESRSYCKKCRLAKCFAVGMKRDLILNESQKKVRRQKIQHNRLRRMGIPVPEEEEVPPEPEVSPENTESPSGSTESASNPFPEVKTHVIAGEIAPEQLEGLPEVTRLKINEIIRAFQQSFDCPMDKPPMTNPSSNADFLNMADASVRRLVKMSKQLRSFQNLQQEDQIALLKGAVVEVLILRSVKMFDTQNVGWSVDKSGSPHSVSAAALQYGNMESIEFFQQYKRFATSVMVCTKKDNIILMILIVLSVLAPDRANIKHKESVEAAQEEYALLLKDYIECQYPKEIGMFPRVLQRLADIRELNEAHTKMLLHMSIDELEPLIVEIFDLSSGL